MRTRITSLALIALIPLLLGCGGESEGSGSAPVTAKKKPPPLTHVWPPVVGEPYPDLALVDQTGKTTKISDFRGKVVVVEPIGMDCPGCQAFAGAHEKGVFGKASAQEGLGSAHSFIERFAGVKLPDARVVYIQLLLYDMKRRNAPTPADGAAWAKHFGMERDKNMVVLVGTQSYIGGASFKMIPGFHLIDREGVCRGDSSGHHPKESLVDAFLPRMGKLVAEKKAE